MPEALEWYRKAADAPLSDEVAQWKVRAALRAQDWGLVRSTIEKMPAALAEQPAWIYWLGRAYRSGGRVEDANTLFAKIAGQPNFYGNLADEELGRIITTPPRAASPTPDENARMAANPGLRRALALFRVNLRSEGVKEWNWALRGLSDRELLAASGLAHRAGIYDRAIAAADRTQNEHDYSLRYLSPYSDQVRPAAKNQALDDAWVYGLMRQESRFVSNARSTVGASGLMQLMPATARWVAKKIGLKDFHQGQVNDTQTNVLLGTTYMRLVLESLDNHPVLASAAYNAGPGRARKWRADTPLEGAVYAETIPFNETRDYVKKVMSNSVYYSALFDGQPQSLKNRLGVIGPRTTGEPKGGELP
jgi:soluble lytic murein transglycosylase